MAFIHECWHLLINLLLNTETTLDALVIEHGRWIYAILFVIIFCETGLVVTPFLPGDSLLFLAAAIAHRPHSPLNIITLVVVLIIAAMLGDTVNYMIGHFFGHKLFRNPNSKIFKQSYLRKTELFFEKHGGKSILLGRFVPVVRTFVPFVAGMGSMKYKHFFIYNLLGAVVWTLLFSLLGFFVGGMQVVQHNLKLVVVFIIIISILPAIYGFVKNKYFKKAPL